MIITADDLSHAGLSGKVKAFYKGCDISNIVTEADPDEGWAEVVLFFNKAAFADKDGNPLTVVLRNDLEFTGYEEFVKAVNSGELARAKADYKAEKEKIRRELTKMPKEVVNAMAVNIKSQVLGSS